MAISELQIVLIGAGTVAVGMVWGYNVWQERQHRKSAEKIFKGGQGDVLLGSADSGQRTDVLERQEPHFPDEADAVNEPLADAGAAETAAPDSEPLSALPVEFADSLADCVLYFSAAEPIPAPAVWAMQNAWAGELSKPVHWLAKKVGDGDVDGAWKRVDDHDAGRYREWAVALQLVDRRGPVSDGELARFFDGIQQLVQQVAASMELPSRGELVMRAAELDAFCAAVDIQFVLHVVEASGGVFAGTKLRWKRMACLEHAMPAANFSRWQISVPNASMPTPSSPWLPMA
jgi:hypothetical protein